MPKTRRTEACFWPAVLGVTFRFPPYCQIDVHFWRGDSGCHHQLHGEAHPSIKSQRNVATKCSNILDLCNWNSCELLRLEAYNVKYGPSPLNMNLFSSLSDDKTFVQNIHPEYSIWDRGPSYFLDVLVSAPDLVWNLRTLWDRPKAVIPFCSFCTLL